MSLEVVTQEPIGSPKPHEILFIHGLWHAAWYWQVNFMPYFAERGYRSHAVSLRGHGGSNGSQKINWVSLADYVEDVSEVVDGMEKTPVLVGHSAGGAIIQKYLEHNDAPAAVLLASMPSIGAMPCTIRFALRHPGAFIKTNLTLNLRHIIGTQDLYQEAMFSDKLPREKLRDYYSRTQKESYRVFLDMVILNLSRPRKVSKKILVIGSSNDGFFTTQEYEKTAQAYNADLEIFEGIGHMMPLDVGWEAVADRMITWIDSNVQ